MSQDILPPTAGDELRQHIEGEEAIQEAAVKAALLVGEAIEARAHQDAAQFAKIPGEIIPSDQQFFSLGWLCQHFQLAPFGIRYAMQQAGAKFVRAENGIPFVDGIGRILIEHYLRTQRVEQ